jgi:hypothetical protein
MRHDPAPVAEPTRVRGVILGLTRGVSVYRPFTDTGVKRTFLVVPSPT